ERKASDTDLTHQVAKTDRKEGGEDWLGPDDLAGHIDHDRISPNKDLRISRLAGTASCRAKLLDNSVHKFGRRRRRVSVLVFEIHCLPLELAHLVERLNLDPFDILHRRDEFGDAIDISRIIGESRHEGEAYPHGLVQFRKAFGKAQGWRQITAGDRLVRVGVRALDIEQNQIENPKIGLVYAVTEKTGSFDRRMQTHVLRAGQDALSKGKLHQDLTA